MHSPPSSVTRRAVLAAAAAVALTGCARTDATTDSTQAPATPGTTEVPTRFGPVAVPRAPQRVVTMYDTSTDFAHVLGLPLVGIGGSGPAGRELPEYQRNLGLESLSKVSTFPEPDLEAILALRPDLVLDDFALDEAGAKKLLAAVPTYSFPTEAETVDWRQLLRQLSTIFGAEATAKSFIEAYDTRAAELRSRVQAKWAGAKFAYVGPYEDGTYYVAQATMTTNQVMHGDLGLAFAKAVPADVASRKVDVSMERLGELADADLLLLRTNPKEDGTGVNEAQTKAFRDSPLWRKLPAVRADHAYLISGALFYTSPLTPAANLDWAEKNLL